MVAFDIINRPGVGDCADRGESEAHAEARNGENKLVHEG